MPIVVSGAANMAKLLVATMAVAGAYVGAQASQAEPAGVPALSSMTPSGSAATSTGSSTTGAFADRPTRVMTLTTRADETGTPDLTQTDVAADTTADTAQQVAPAPGRVVVTAMPGGADCERTYRVRTMIDPAGSGVSYAWQVVRWNSSTRGWQPYFASRSGFTGGPRAVEWRPRIGGNPGRYRVRLDVGSRTYESAAFQVTC
ncbi:hypothetical protein GCM10023193_15400 [Planotetraspora kaengkrachanensis]|uniref:Secreted protein n=2 Tax=Planotetraspora kaengkrachanensis TaxID=575193 RepID=A0A8J3PR50_9ACTN|nr:hypothetical protein Pka01_11910 [Planotetraspora kaengkrachanensis]